MDSNQQPKQGEFPFKIMAGEEESHYTSWIRNHSSYLNIDGLQAVATYVLGILAVLAPALVIIGFGLGLLHFWMLAYPV